MTKKSQFQYEAGSALAFGVTKVPEGVQFGICLPEKQRCYLKLYLKNHKTPSCVIELTKKYQKGSAYFLTISKSLDNPDERTLYDILSQDYEYMYEADGEEFIDPYADYVTGRQHWNKTGQGIQRGGICIRSFDWKEDEPLRISYSDLILYQLHVRGFTKHSSSKVKHKGTFAGVMEKIPYLVDLGISGVLLLPVYEFNERMDEKEKNYPWQEKTQTEKVNYWGYGTKETYYFAPKAAYSSSDCPSLEFKQMVQAFHENGMEVLLDMYFMPGTNVFLMTDCLRNWVLKYHVDGFRVNQEVMPSLMLVSDPILSGVKLLGNYWDETMLSQAEIADRKETLAEYNEGFMTQARKFLKSDEGMVETMVQAFSKNPKEHAVINFFAHVNGFTMMDMVSYDIKHNDANGELNQDGTEYNYSWNCGVEGKTRKKAILDKRMVQLRNAFLMLFTSQGTPMLLAGDEFGNTQLGNNNAYCQDNEISWLQWNKTKTSAMLHDYVKSMIAFRKCFPVLHQRKALQMMDTISCGMPDLSVHGVQAWRPDYSYYSRMLGLLYFGQYVDDKQGRSVYIVYNMFWEQKSFDLPNLPNGYTWKAVIDTYDDTVNKELFVQKKRPAKNRKNRQKQSQLQKKTVVPPRSIVVFVECNDS